ncbi:hypothetical protein ACTFIW_002673 [Dictyostelium discoideum]
MEANCFFDSLPNYLKYKIFILLVDNSNKCQILFDRYQLTGEYIPYDESEKFNESFILSYSLVCKSWFNFVSKSITTISSTKYNKIILKNQQHQQQQLQLLKQQQEKLESYCLIKEKNIEIFIEDGFEENDTNSKYKSEIELVNRFPNLVEILYNFLMDYDGEINDRDKEFLEEYKFSKLSKIRFVLFLIMGELDENYWNSLKLKNNNNNNNNNLLLDNLDTLKLSLFNESESLFKIISRNFQPSKLLLVDDMIDWSKSNIHFYDLLKSIKGVEFLKIKNQFINPIVLCNPIESNNHLKYVDVKFHFHELIFHMKRLNGDNINSFKSYLNQFGISMINFEHKYDNDDYYNGLCICDQSFTGNGSIKRTKHTLNDWSKFCNSILSLKNLSTLKISEICQFNKNNKFYIKDDDDNEKDGNIIPTYFTTPLINLIENTNSIKKLSLIDMDIIVNELILSSFVNNDSIVYLNLSGSINSSNELNHLLFNVLPLNKTIKSLKILKLPFQLSSITQKFININNGRILNTDFETTTTTTTTTEIEKKTKTTTLSTSLYKLTIGFEESQEFSSYFQKLSIVPTLTKQVIFFNN